MISALASLVISQMPGLSRVKGKDGGNEKRRRRRAR